MTRESQVQPIEARHLEALLGLCREHAAYESAEFSEAGQVERWHAALFATPPAVYCWLAIVDGQPCGFMTVTVDFATWTAEFFAHMDCLFIREPYRGLGLGGAFFATLREFCVTRELKSAQWQTPPDNELGIGFYRRLGATAKPKLRYSYEIAAHMAPC